MSDKTKKPGRSLADRSISIDLPVAVTTATTAAAEAAGLSPFEARQIVRDAAIEHLESMAAPAMLLASHLEKRREALLATMRPSAAEKFPARAASSAS